MREKLPYDAKELLEFFVLHNAYPRDPRHHLSDGRWVGCSGFSKFSGELLFQSYDELRLLKQQEADRYEYMFVQGSGAAPRYMLAEPPPVLASSFVPDQAPPPARWQSPSLSNGNSWLTRLLKGS